MRNFVQNVLFMYKYMHLKKIYLFINMLLIYINKYMYLLMYLIIIKIYVFIFRILFHNYFYKQANYLDTESIL